jgi:hypothetical protein
MDRVADHIGGALLAFGAEGHCDSGYGSICGNIWISPAETIGAHEMSVNDYDVELFEAIEDLVAEGELEAGSNAFGVAQQVIHNGMNL